MLTGNDASVEKFESCYHLERKRFIPLKRMKDYNPLELENVCFKGTYIVGGNAKAVVVSTGKIRIREFFILVVVERLNV